ncbi:hypothetical protein [Zobellia uliginosa]|uniref:hypothetical protein n=1 Tax=Zobellia uliginosa TaxID=143224 RepID=UPI0026E3494E|nr:hypothetical protein [Zobellia uliginosa]MDO6516892.1 hypothetical protein [Zobellia uliginosa]
MKKINFSLIYFLIVVSYSCTPKFSMTIKPTTLCPGEEFKIEWGSNDIKKLRVETTSPTDPPFSGEIAKEGKVNLTAEESTRITMYAPDNSNLGEKIIDVQIIDEDITRTLDFLWSGCVVARGQRVGYIPLSDLSVSSGITIKGVVNTSGRHIILSHSGVSIPLAPNEVTNGFNSNPYKGEWSVRLDPRRIPPIIDLFTIEGCPLDETNPDPKITYVDPPSLTVSITMGC